MSGYTPVFGTLFQGSLCGQWPALPLFCTLLPLADKHGEIDLSFGYLAATTGWPEDLLRQGIEQLEQPDPHSRSPDDDGRRLVRLRDNTEWGWRIVNHGKYREKARLAAKNAVDVATGKEAGRKRYSRAECPPVSAGVRRSPPVSDPSNANANTNKEKEGAASPAPVGLNLPAWERWLDYRKAIKKPLRPVSIPAAQRELAAFGADQSAVVEQSVANGWQGLFALKPKAANGKPPERRIETPPTPDQVEAARRKAAADNAALHAKLAGVVGRVA
jgi:hypothetical protein